MGRWIENTEQKKRERRRHVVACIVLALIFGAVFGVNALAAFVATHREYGFGGAAR